MNIFSKILPKNPIVTLPHGLSEDDAVKEQYMHHSCAILAAYLIQDSFLSSN